MEDKIKVKEEYLIYLDVLRESGVTNMFGAGSYLFQAFPELTKNEANEVLKHWMDTFSERNKENENA